MHHRPVGPPLAARLSGAFTRSGLMLRAFLRVRAGRLLLAGVVTTAVTALVLALPVVSGLGSGSQSMVLDSSSSVTASPSDGNGSPVVMGVDGGPVDSSAFAGAVASATTAETAIAAPGTTGSAPAGPETTSAPAAEQADPPITTARGSASQPGSSPGSPSVGSPSPRSPSVGSPSSSPGLPSGSGVPSVPVRPAPNASEPPLPAPQEQPAEADDEDELVALLDEAREGCRPLSTDGALAAAARAHSAAMREARELTPLDGGAVSRDESDPSDVLRDWLADDASRSALLDCGRGSVGVGLVRGPGGPWWTLLLA